MEMIIKKELKKELYNNLILEDFSIKRQDFTANEIIRGIFYRLMEDQEKLRLNGKSYLTKILPDDACEHLLKGAEEGPKKYKRCVCDFFSGCTDVFALRLHEKIMTPSVFYSIAS